MRPRYNSMFVRLYILCASLALGLAFAIWVGGGPRFNGPSFTTPRAMVEWSGMDPFWVWGGLFFVYGLWLVFSLGRPSGIHALRFGVVVYLFFCITLGGSVAAQPQASITGVVVYGCAAALHLFLSDHLTHRGWEGC